MSFGQSGGGNGSRDGSGRRESNFESKPKPVEVGKEYDVTISEISRRGDGIAKIDGFIIFVAGGKQGQSAKIKVTQVSDRYAMGTVVEGSAMAATPVSASGEFPEPREMAEEMEVADE